ncbi:MAG: peroxiredoxin [Betaproteobacteria bacterium]|nr:MAG: peroxiredoxin [Betaproteobacteria bacterium]
MRRVICAVATAALLLGQSCVWAALPAAGSQASDFSLADQSGKTRTLAEFRGKWVVLYFYPKDDTPGCTEEACSFRDDIFKLSQLGAQVVGVSLDDSASHAQFAKKFSLPFPLLADPSGVVTRSYGALPEGSRYARRYTFLIDPAGKVAKVYTSVETSRHSVEVIDDLKRLSKK